MVFSDDQRLFALDSTTGGQHSERHLFVADAATGTDICTIPIAYQ
jgi:hypothetical protein